MVKPLRTCAWLLPVLMAISSAAQTCTPNAPGGPVVPATPVVVILPELVAGSPGFVTKISIVNLTGSANTVTVNNISSAGLLLTSNSCTIPANGVVRIDTPENQRYKNPADVYWAMIGAQAAIGATTFFDFIPSDGTRITNAVGFNNIVSATSFTFPVEFDPTVGKTFGLAITNPNNVHVDASVQLLNSDGALRETLAIPLNAFNQRIADLATDPTTHFTTLPNGDFVGIMKVSSALPVAAFAAGDDTGPFYSAVSVEPPAAASSGAVLSATFTLPTNTAFFNGNCDSSMGVSVPGAAGGMTVAVSPASDPSLKGLPDVIWAGFVDAADHVKLQFCKIGRTNASSTSPLAFNIRVFPASQTGGSGSVTLNAGTSIPVATCSNFGATVAGATTGKTIVMSPAEDPTQHGLNGFSWRGLADAANHVTGTFCSFGGQSATVSGGPLNFNIGVIN